MTRRDSPAKKSTRAGQHGRWRARNLSKRLGRLVGLVVLLGLYAAYERDWFSNSSPGGNAPASVKHSPNARAPAPHADAAQLAQAFAQRQSDVQLRGTGQVVALLPDDNEGSRHQRFLLETDAGHSLLIVHNIDLAPRINTLARGDRIEFYGEYEWNAKGGLVHWTHRDPRGRHAHGYIIHQGLRYE